MNHTYKKLGTTPQPKGIRSSRHTNSRNLRKRMDRIDRRRLNNEVKKFTP